MLPARAGAHSQAQESLQSLLLADVVRKGHKLSEQICSGLHFRKKIQGNTELKDFILGIVGVGEKDQWK